MQGGDYNNRARRGNLDHTLPEELEQHRVNDETPEPTANSRADQKTVSAKKIEANRRNA
jgi:hypothetical protein